MRQQGSGVEDSWRLKASINCCNGGKKLGLFAIDMLSTVVLKGVDADV